LKTIHTAVELDARANKVCLAIGFFDGVHLGHQQIIRQTMADARQHEATALVLTFDRHPNTVVAPARVPPLIYPLPQKLRVIESLDVDALLLIHFDKTFSEQTGEAFVRGLAKDLPRIQSLCVGADFTFGHQRSGHVVLLQKLGTELGFAVHGMAAVSLDDKTISSTRIREAIQAGDFDRVGQMLGRAYSLAGKVMKGDCLGRPMGFPTANLDVAGLVLPPTGVYMAHVSVRGETHRAVVNIGVRPTLPNPNPPVRVEAHLLDFDRDLYGAELEIIFSERLRDEQKFASVDELRKQIARDITEARKRF
jgi:riboflavin kinase / FMN adenylyltransferase